MEALLLHVTVGRRADWAVRGAARDVDDATPAHTTLKFTVHVTWLDQTSLQQKEGPTHTRAKRRSPSRTAVARARGHAACTAEEFLQKVEGTSKWQPSACRYSAPPADDVDAAAAWRMSRWQHATPGAAAAACPRRQHVCAGCPRRSMCRQRGRRVNARKFIYTSLATLRHDSAAVESMAGRASRVSSTVLTRVIEYGI